MNQTNGAITDYEFTLDSFVHIMDRDILKIQMPNEVQILSTLECKAVLPDPIGIIDASCSSNQQLLTVQFNDVDQLEGQFKFIASNIKNPPSTKKTSQASGIFMTTYDFKNIQELKKEQYKNLVI